jgi:hypothetical protein
MSGQEWDLAEIGLRRLGSQDIAAFWLRYATFCGSKPLRGSLWSRWREVSDDTIISLYLTNHSVGLFVRGQRGEKHETTLRRLESFEPALGLELGSALRGEYRCCYLASYPSTTLDPAAWPDAFAWLDETERRYLATLRIVLSGR